MQNISERATQKAFLREIVAHDFCLPEGIEPFAFVQALLPNLGSIDEELRDQLTYPIILHIILDAHERYPLTGAQLEELFHICSDTNHLFSGIGVIGRDSVFMRTFSCLMFPLLLIADARRPSFSEETSRRVFAALLTYAKQERDWRGYIKGKGWAHAVAHLSDALDDCAKNRFMTVTDCEAILETLTYLAQLPEPLCHEEDDRLAFVAYGIMTRQAVERAFLKKWIASLVIVRSDDVLSEEGVRIMYRATNAKNFLRSLYFLLSWSKVATLAEQKAELLSDIDQALQRLNSLSLAWFAGEETQ